MTNSYDPDWISHPMESVRDRLEEIGMTEAEFCEQMGITKEDIEKNERDEQAWGVGFCAVLAQVIGGKATFWWDRQTLYLEKKRLLAGKP